VCSSEGSTRPRSRWHWSRGRRDGAACSPLAGSPAAYALLAAMTLLLVEVLPSAGPAAAYAQWD